MKICFLCGEKDPNKMSLEHSIPKFLYGTKANDKFKKQEICKRCNNKLGIYVDMKFARSFPVYTALNRINKDNLYGFSSIIFNNNHQVKSLLTRNQYIEILVNVFCTIFWIKDNTEDFLTFPGGDPRLARNASKLYVFISERSINNSMNYLEKIKIIKDILTDIKKQFKKYKNIEILLCINFGITLAKNIKNKKNVKYKFNSKNKVLTRVRIKRLRHFIEHNINVEHIKFIWNFSKQETRIKNILSLRNKTFNSRYIFDMGDYLRFCAKIFLGILCGLLGNNFNSSKIGNDLIRIINSYSNENILREIDFKRVRPLFLEKFQENITDLNRLFIKNAISISIIKVDCQIIGIISIDSFKIDFYIGDASNLSTEQKKILGFGFTDNNSASGITLLLEDSAICYKEVSYAEYLSYCCKENLEKCLDIL